MEASLLSRTPLGQTEEANQPDEAKVGAPTTTDPHRPPGNAQHRGFHTLLNRSPLSSLPSTPPA